MEASGRRTLLQPRGNGALCGCWVGMGGALIDPYVTFSSFPSTSYAVSKSPCASRSRQSPAGFLIGRGGGAMPFVCGRSRFRFGGAVGPTVSCTASP